MDGDDDDDTDDDCNVVGGDVRLRNGGCLWLTRARSWERPRVDVTFFTKY